MKKIKLTKGKYAIVDDEDYESLSKFQWHISGTGYAARQLSVQLGRNKEMMHRVVNGTPEGLSTDHINHDKLDNRKSNLRSCTSSQNQRNRGNPVNNTSGRKGVVWHGLRNKWTARIQHNKQMIYLGLFESKADAIKAREEAENKYHKEFSYSNA